MHQDPPVAWCTSRLVTRCASSVYWTQPSFEKSLLSYSNHLFSFILFLVSDVKEFVPTRCLFQSLYDLVHSSSSLYVPLYLWTFVILRVFPVCTQCTLFCPISNTSICPFSICFSMRVSDHSYSLYHSCGWSLAWSLPYMSCHLYMHPWGSISRVSLRDVHVYLTARPHSHKGCVSISYQWVQFEDNTHGVPLSSLNADDISMWSIAE